jgi:hypothetical protein
MEQNCGKYTYAAWQIKLWLTLGAIEKDDERGSENCEPVTYKYRTQIFMMI